MHVWADHNITDAELREFQLAAQMLGFGTLTNEQVSDCAFVRAKPAATTLSVLVKTGWGKTVCFTGECCCSIRNQPISRELAEQMAGEQGFGHDIRDKEAGHVGGCRPEHPVGQAKGDSMAFALSMNRLLALPWNRSGLILDRQDREAVPCPRGIP